MFTVFGATGNTGSGVAERLLAAGRRVRVVVRRPEAAAAWEARGAEVGELEDAPFVARALAGAEGAYLLAPPDLASPDLLAKNRRIVDHYVAGLDAHAVPHAVFLSSVGAQVPSGTGPTAFSRYGEQALQRASGTRLCIVRAPFFMENLLGNAHVMKTDGVLPVFGGGESRPFPMIATADIARVAADALLAPSAGNRWIELEGPREYSFVDAAAMASDILGRPVTATPLPRDAMVPILVAAGFSESVAGLFRELNEAIGRGVVQYEGHPRARGAVGLDEVLRAGLA
jgi:uncharacterized protein YbjT (DUF2867 family)